MIRLRERHARAPGASRRDGLVSPLRPDGHAPEAPVRTRGPALAPALSSEGRVRAANGQQTSEIGFAQPCRIESQNTQKPA